MAQYLADQFWLRWRREYLQILQARPKWLERQRYVTEGDVVLIKDKDVSRNEWPIGRVVEALNSEDGGVRKAKVIAHRDGKLKTIFRPIWELVLLLQAEKETLDDGKDNISLGDECDV